jgi:hypothetical protein
VICEPIAVAAVSVVTVDAEGKPVALSDWIATVRLGVQRYVEPLRARHGAELHRGAGAGRGPGGRTVQHLPAHQRPRALGGQRPRGDVAELAKQLILRPVELAEPGQRSVGGTGRADGDRHDGALRRPGHVVDLRCVAGFPLALAGDARGHDAGDLLMPDVTGRHERCGVFRLGFGLELYLVVDRRQVGAGGEQAHVLEYELRHQAALPRMRTVRLAP